MTTFTDHRLAFGRKSGVGHHGKQQNTADKGQTGEKRISRPESRKSTARKASGRDSS